MVYERQMGKVFFSDPRCVKLDRVGGAAGLTWGVCIEEKGGSGQQA